jgi:hypothetical protein
VNGGGGVWGTVSGIGHDILDNVYITGSIGGGRPAEATITAGQPPAPAWGSLALAAAAGAAVVLLVKGSS